jgi:hypothetical protein
MASLGNALYGNPHSAKGQHTVGQSTCSGHSSGSSLSGTTRVSPAQLAAAFPVNASNAIPSQQPASTCVEPDHRELIRSVGTVLHRRVRDNESADTKLTLPLFLEDTHTAPEPEERYEVSLPMLHLQQLGFPTLYTLRQLPPPEAEPKTYDIPGTNEIATFIENIRQKARLTPQALVITLIYVDRLEARSEGVLLHARSWKPIVFASLLLASKVWHDISYWNSDFSSICPMFTVRNINRMERQILTLLQYNTIISASQYAQYYFSLRHTVRVPEMLADDGFGENSVGRTSTGDTGGGDNFRSKYFMAISVGAPSKLPAQSAAVASSRRQEVEPVGASMLGIDTIDRPIGDSGHGGSAFEGGHEEAPYEDHDGSGSSASGHSGKGMPVGRRRTREDLLSTSL